MRAEARAGYVQRIATPPTSEAELEAAIARLNRGDRLERAEAIVSSAAPALQGVLAEALAAGGWFEDSHLKEIERAIESEDPGQRLVATRTLLAEETRVAMMVGVAVGWALAGELDESETEPSQED